MMDRVPGLSEDNFNKMRDMLREHAPEAVAYSMEQITGYKGVESPLTIDLNATVSIINHARRNWSPAELEIIDAKCTELLDTGVCIRVAASNYACNHVLAMKRPMMVRGHTNTFA